MGDRRVKNPFVGITVWKVKKYLSRDNRSASLDKLMMPNYYPRNGFFRPHLALLKDSYNPITGHALNDYDEIARGQ